jgi:epoxyqueuosine reductase QueG
MLCHTVFHEKPKKKNAKQDHFQWDYWEKNNHFKGLPIKLKKHWTIIRHGIIQISNSNKIKKNKTDANQTK